MSEFSKFLTSNGMGAVVKAAELCSQCDEDIPFGNICAECLGESIRAERTKEYQKLLQTKYEGNRIVLVE